MPEPPPDLLPGAPHDELEGFVEDSLTTGIQIQGPSIWGAAVQTGPEGRDAEQRRRGADREHPVAELRPHFRMPAGSSGQVRTALAGGS